MNKMIAAPALVAAGLFLTACSGKSYTYEVAVQVTGQGSAEITVEYPSQPGNSDNKSPDSTPSRSTTTEKLPFNQKLLAAGLGPVSVSAKSADGTKVTCAITLEKDSPVVKDGTGTVKCDTDITENTDN